MFSKPQITPLRRADIPELSQFLTSGFNVSATSPCFSHEVLSWKYFDGPSGPTEVSTCSYVARSANKIVGHIGICPRQFVIAGSSAAPVSTMHAIDWLVSTPNSGSGAFLMMQAFGTCKTQYAVGGSDQAQAVFPKLGFEQKPGVAVYRKVLAPLHRLRTDEGLLRRCAGTVKDIVSVWRRRTPRATQTVELRPVTTFTEEIDCLLRQCSTSIVTCQRDHSLLNYFLRYPQAGFSGWTIHSSGKMIGFVILKISPYGHIQLGKIVDCWLDTEDTSCWQAAVTAILDRLRLLSAYAVTCYATTPSLRSALLWSGFTKSGETNVYLRDKGQSLPRDLPFGLSMLEADHAIL